MPELPEVEIVKQGLAPVLAGQKMAVIDILREDLRKPIPKNFKGIFEGKKATRITRRGKYILIFTESGEGFALHLGMSGRIKILSSKTSVLLEKHDHVIWKMEDGTHIIFNDPRRFGMLFLLNNKDWATHAPFAAMGPEPLEKNFTGIILHEKLSGRRTPVKTALLDQRVVAGIGNIYACEALYEAGIQPEKLAWALTLTHSEKLAAAIRNVLNKAIAAGGSSLRDYKHTDGSQGYFQHEFSVYDRESVACATCDCDVLKTGGVKRIVQAGRSTYYCERKQT